jgi:hypothetical protein
VPKKFIAPWLFNRNRAGGGLDDAPAVLGDLGVAQFGPNFLQRRERTFLIGPLSRE